jgi:hypothetical protein
MTLQGLESSDNETSSDSIKIIGCRDTSEKNYSPVVTHSMKAGMPLSALGAVGLQCSSDELYCSANSAEESISLLREFVGFDQGLGRSTVVDDAALPVIDGPVIRVSTGLRLKNVVEQ